MQTSRHHLRCKANGGRGRKNNISKVDSKKHRAWHLLFDSWEAPRIAEEINQNWIDPKWKLVAIRRRTDA